MAVLILFLSAGIVCIGITPKILTQASWQIRFPRLALSAWLIAFFLGIACLASFGVLAVYLSMVAGENYALWWNITITVLAWMFLLTLGAIFALLWKLRETQRHLELEMVHELVGKKQETLKTKRSGLTIIIFSDSTSRAHAIGGKRPQIFVSTRLVDSLQPELLQAVLAHEYAHIVLKHHEIRKIIEINARSLPFVSSGQKLRSAVNLLIELVADDRAARQVGPAHLANALAKLATDTDDPTLNLRAARLANYRWPASFKRNIPPQIFMVS